MGRIEPQELFLNAQLPVMTGRDVFNIIATCRRDVFLYHADLLQLVARHAQKPDETPPFLTGKIQRVIPTPSGQMVSVKDFRGKIWDIQYTPSMDTSPIGAKDVVIFSNLEASYTGVFDRLMGKKTKTLSAANCGTLVTAAERAFLAANKQSHLVIARPMSVGSGKHEIALNCEPIHGPNATLRCFKGAMPTPPPIGKPFIAAVTHHGGGQYIPVGTNRYMPLAADLIPHIFC